MVKTTDPLVELELDAAKDWYLALSYSQKQRFLGAVGHDLTVSFRGYGQDAILNPKFWFGVNELHNALYGAINALGAEIDIQTVWEHLFFVASKYNLTDILTSRLAAAKDQITLSDAMRERGVRGKAGKIESTGGNDA